MKAYFFKIILLPFSLLVACGNHRQVIDFIPGTYVNVARSEYSIANDTLTISPVENTPGSYLILRNTGFRRIVEGKLLPAEQKLRNLNGLWNEQKQVLEILQNGVVVTFQPAQHKLRIQNSEYAKLN